MNEQANNIRTKITPFINIMKMKGILSMEKMKNRIIKIFTLFYNAEYKEELRGSGKMYETMRWFLGYRSSGTGSNADKSPFGMFLKTEIPDDFVDIIFRKYILLRDSFLEGKGMTPKNNTMIRFHEQDMNFEKLSGHLDVYFELIIGESMENVGWQPNRVAERIINISNKKILKLFTI
jgi:hypothetical protein